jgi:hypothetical protein
MDSGKHWHLVYVSVTTKFLVAADRIRNESQLRPFIHLKCKNSLLFRIKKKKMENCDLFQGSFIPHMRIQNKNIRLDQGCTNSRRQVAVATRFRNAQCLWVLVTEHAMWYPSGTYRFEVAHIYFGKSVHLTREQSTFQTKDLQNRIQEHQC